MGYYADAEAFGAEHRSAFAPLVSPVGSALSSTAGPCTTVARIVSCCGSDSTDQALRASRALSPSTSRSSFRTLRSTYSTAPTAALSGTLRRVTICWV